MYIVNHFWQKRPIILYSSILYLFFCSPGKGNICVNFVLFMGDLSGPVIFACDGNKWKTLSCLCYGSMSENQNFYLTLC